MSTIKEEQFVDIFKHGLKIIPRTLSVKTLLSERNLKRINYRPYYQRNYVWDNEKQTFFIESVLLGTEIPPLILYKSGVNTEVIDGRQRFETLKRFKENEFPLSMKGLMDLPALGRKTFNKLDDELKEIFLSSNIRVFEFEVVSTITLDIEDKIKKEIFRRYNTGITPLTSVEVDSAKYDNDPFSDRLEDALETNEEFVKGLHDCFFPNDQYDANLKGKMIDFLRRSYVLPKFPISKYATGSDRTMIIGLLYDAITENVNSVDDYLKQCNLIISLYNKLSKDDPIFAKKKLLYETVLWAIMIMNQENVSYNPDNEYQSLKEHYKSEIEKYSDDNSYFYKNVIERFSDTASIFHTLFGLDFDIYLKNAGFNSELKSLKQGEQDVKNVVQQLDNLRINKPSPVSKPIEEILSDVVTNRYLVRPSYQRQEKISEQKAASIIESILLGISLPPIFVYKRKNGIKEVVDGQQRLLSIIAFIGKQYRDENDKLTYSKNNNFKLIKLKILKELNGKNYSSLSTTDQDKILDFVIDEIIIEEKLNTDFDPTDLFIRLNQKPYPIQQNSFEMWNSTVNKSVIEKIKEVTKSHLSWFYSKESHDVENRTDRMENEELITLLTYIDYIMDKDSYDKVLGTFKRIDRITCRVKDKNTITDYLMKLEENNSDKDYFLQYLDRTNKKIIDFGSLFDTNLSKDTLNLFFNVKRSQIFRRSFQDFYIVWIVLHYNEINSYSKETTKSTIHKMLCLLRNVDNQEVNEDYFSNFETQLKIITKNSNNM